MPADDSTIRPFKVGFPFPDVTDLRLPRNRDQVAGARDVSDDSQACRSDHAGPRGLLGRRIRLAPAARRG